MLGISVSKEGEISLTTETTVPCGPASEDLILEDGTIVPGIPFECGEPSPVDREEPQIPQTLPEGYCWIPQDLMRDFPLMNYAPCFEIEAAYQVQVGDPPVPTTSTISVPLSEPVNILPETGLSAFWVGFVLLACALTCGGLWLRSWARKAYQ